MLVVVRLWYSFLEGNMFIMCFRMSRLRNFSNVHLDRYFVTVCTWVREWDYVNGNNFACCILRVLRI
jgi:hypothetical protein